MLRSGMCVFQWINPAMTVTRMGAEVCYTDRLQIRQHCHDLSVRVNFNVLPAIFVVDDA